MTKTTSAVQIALSDITLNQGSFDPSVAGLTAPIGSKYWRGTAVSGDWTKTGAGAMDWTAVPTGIYFNVKDPAYGATGDGATDDRAAIQLAIDDASVAGGTVYFPTGTFVCGKSGANPYSFLLNNVDNVRFLGTGWGGSVIQQDGDAGAGAYNLFRISGGSDSTEFELLTFDQSGISNVGANQCHCINVLEASIVKVVNCRFTGGVANAGAYVKTGGSAGDTCELIWVTGCYMSDPGGPAVWCDGETSKVWIVDSTLTNTLDDETILLDDSITAAITDVKIMGNHIENSARYGIHAVSPTGLLSRIQMVNNLILGWVVIDGIDRSQFQNNEIYTSVAAIGDANVMLANATEFQLQNNVVGRESTTAAGILVDMDTCSRVQLQNNIWIQEEPSSGLVYGLDCANVQLSGNVTHATNVGATVADGYLFEAVAVDADNIQIVNENITADAGTYTNAIRLLANGANIANIQVNGSILDDCDVGVLFDGNGGGAAVFTGLLMVAGNIIEADTNAWDCTESGVYVRIGGNASTFGPNIISGDGTPEANVTARIGSLYLQRDGGESTTLYYKESLTTSSGWIGVGGSVLVFGAGDTGDGDTSVFLGPGYVATAGATELQITATRPGTIRNLYIQVETAGTDAATVTFTVRKNGVDTALTTTIANTATGAASDTTNSFTVIAGDLISISMTRSAAVTAGQDNLTASVELA